MVTVASSNVPDSPSSTICSLRGPGSGWCCANDRNVTSHSNCPLALAMRSTSTRPTDGNASRAALTSSSVASNGRGDVTSSVLEGIVLSSLIVPYRSWKDPPKGVGLPPVVSIRCTSNTCGCAIMLGQLPTLLVNVTSHSYPVRLSILYTSTSSIVDSASSRCLMTSAEASNAMSSVYSPS